MEQVFREELTFLSEHLIIIFPSLIGERVDEVSGDVKT